LSISSGKIRHHTTGVVRQRGLHLKDIISPFLVDEPAEDVIYTAKRSKSFSAVKLNTKGFKFNRDEANER